ncbi:MAG TPA: DUF1592 domain-containing protein [Polyangiaceae bacterium]|nr:DUF1592 domain-containing protein [Polyangiaceae bacterium]
MSKLNKHYCAALLACSGLISGCGLWSNDSEGTPEGHAGNGSAGNGSAGLGFGGGNAANGGASQGGASNEGGNAGFVGPGDPCRPGVPVTSQIPRLLNRQYAAVMRDLLGVTALPSTGTGGDQPLSNFLVADFDGPLNTQAWDAYQDVAEKIAHAVMTGPNRSKFISCDPAQAGCMDNTIETFGRKAFRRPLSDDELVRFQQLGKTTPAPSAAELAETTLFAFLVSPSFLMLSELATDKQVDGKIQLSSNEVATRLSMMLWDSIPDDQLNTAADKNELQTGEQILAQAKRMLLVKEKVAPVIEAFHQYWTHGDDPGAHWWKGHHDATRFPLYTANAATAMQAELDAFFDDVIFGHGTFADLFLSNAAFVNRDNAAIYGLDPAGYGTDLKRVELDAKQRSGFLTRAGFLSSYANETRTSPALRGAFIASILGIQIGAPPPGAAQQTVTGDFVTNRQYFEALTQSGPPCRNCHEVFNPAGFALENFDAIGAWQTVDQLGGAIDAKATVKLGNGLQDVEVSSPRELMQAIAKAQKAQDQYVEAWISFAYRRPDSSLDHCLANDFEFRIHNGDYEVLNLITDLTQPDSFRMRVRGTP